MAPTSHDFKIPEMAPPPSLPPRQLKKSVKTLAEDMKRLEKRLTEMISENRRLTKDIYLLKTLESEDSEHKYDTNTMKSRNTYLQRENQRLKQEAAEAAAVDFSINETSRESADIKEEEEVEINTCEDKNYFESVMSKKQQKTLNKQKRKEASHSKPQEETEVNARERTKIHINLINPNKQPKRRPIKSHQYNSTPRVGRKNNLKERQKKTIDVSRRHQTPRKKPYQGFQQMPRLGSLSRTIKSTNRTYPVL
ncbi:unnamed protein product [Psylliodes chrysocephalus]|uniref:Uncharacterized protein n=1 Tax=Psylliodes chrysocephalus TaxID=3402493 RepID=A0A9P0CU82_9CUCU|nr:unnamed protein product [Psylliodes chrysocephala]